VKKGGFKLSDLNLVVSNEEKIALVIDPSDNAAVALCDLKMGDQCTIRMDGKVIKLEVIEDIKFGHKMALDSLAKDESVYKYGEEIGKMKEEIKKGGWIHSHNMYCERGMK
jgi:altronate dehydratase small subunit